ncbi:MAG: hypothetical protein IKE94_12200 [Aeriscardovia sp.]|nr:hypothetical protein [Aeriscardovia sp.]
MTIKKTITGIAALAVIGSVALTGCNTQENNQNTGASEKPTEITDATTGITSQEITTDDTALESDSANGADDARYKNFLEGQYKEHYADILSIPIQDGEDTEGDMYTYMDLNADGINELLVGNCENGIYLIVSEKGGTYCVTETYILRPMGGIFASEYLGNGCFTGNYYLDGKFYKPLFRFNGETGYCDFLAELCEADDGETVIYELYKAKDDKNTTAYYSFNELAIEADDARYEHDKKSYNGDNGDSTGEQDLSAVFSDYVSSCSNGGSGTAFNWLPL